MHANHRIGVDTQRECRLRQTVPVWRVKPDVSDIDSRSYVGMVGYASRVCVRYYPLYRARRGGNVCSLFMYDVYPLHDPVDPSGGVGSTHRAYAHIGETAARTPPPPDDRLRGPGAVDSDWAFLR